MKITRVCFDLCHRKAIPATLHLEIPLAARLSDF
jgi:hypothetical protein